MNPTAAEQIDATDRDIDSLFTTQRPLGPIAVSGSERPARLRAFYDTRVNLHLQSEHSPPTFIVGRRGSGKTALLLSREFDPSNMTVRLSAQGAFSKVQSAADLLSTRMVLTVEGVAELWDLLLWAPIVVRIATSPRHEVDPQLELQILWEETAEARRLIAGDDSYDDTVLSFITGRLIDHIRDSENLIGIDSLRRDFRLAHRPWGEVIRAALEVLRRRGTPVFVLVDSLENVGSHVARIEETLQGLFHHVGNLGLKTSPVNYRVQCCFPSELWPLLDRISANPVKDFAGRMVLQWRWQDLLEAVGMRLRIFLKHRYPKLLRGVGPSDYREHLDRVLPPSFITPEGIAEQTVGYILRHTQLLPRQVLYIFNEALHRAIAATKLPVVRDTDVVSAVAEVEATLCPEVFSAYGFRYPRAHDVARRLIPYLPFSFDDGYLHRSCNRAAIKADFGLDYREVREMFTDLGIIGRYLGETERYLRAEFSYSVDGHLILSPDENYCLHPLFVRQYNAKGSLNRSFGGKPVYPSGMPESLL